MSGDVVQGGVWRSLFTRVCGFDIMILMLRFLRVSTHSSPQTSRINSRSSTLQPLHRRPRKSQPPPPYHPISNPQTPGPQTCASAPLTDCMRDEILPSTSSHPVESPVNAHTSTKITIAMSQSRTSNRPVRALLQTLQFQRSHCTYHILQSSLIKHPVSPHQPSGNLLHRGPTTTVEKKKHPTHMCALPGPPRTAPNLPKLRLSAQGDPRIRRSGDLRHNKDGRDGLMWAEF